MIEALLSLFSFAIDLTLTWRWLDAKYVYTWRQMYLYLTAIRRQICLYLTANMFILDYYLTAIVFILDYYLTPIRYSALYGSHTTLSFFLRPAVGLRISYKLEVYWIQYTNTWGTKKWLPKWRYQWQNGHRIRYCIIQCLTTIYTTFKLNVVCILSWM